MTWWQSARELFMERRVFTEGVQYVLQPWTTIFCKARDDVIESLSGERLWGEDGGLCGGVGEGRTQHRARSGCVPETPMYARMWMDVWRRRLPQVLDPRPCSPCLPRRAQELGDEQRKRQVGAHSGTDDPG